MLGKCQISIVDHINLLPLLFKSLNNWEIFRLFSHSAEAEIYTDYLRSQYLFNQHLNACIHFGDFYLQGKILLPFISS
ncbi:hypothetical protein NIES2100_41490 [Calothrix sp. NIES-2100]|nr:hypothetical protein NIES2100_41490 [Calothrix sp. NIES-2100]